jgi:AraC-like DNA-binding protein
MFRTIRRFRNNAQIDYVGFEYAAPTYHREYARIFEGRVRFEQPFTGLCFDKELMAAASPHPDAELHHALRAFTRSRVLHLDERMAYSARVHQFLVWQRPPRLTTMQSVSRALGVSVRSLRRHLTAEGKRFSDLVSEAQAEIARSCLLDERRTIMDTACELGFSDSTSFHRAFKRWTGLTPSEFRKQKPSVTLNRAHY